jgi:hypothetical protein
MKFSYYLIKLKNKSYEYSIYTNNIKFKTDNFIILNKKIYYYIDTINFNTKFIKGGTCYYNFDILKLGKLNIEREVNNVNLIFDQIIDINDSKPPEKLKQLKNDLDAFLHIFDFNSSNNNIWNRPNHLAFNRPSNNLARTNMNQLTEDKKKNYVKYNILYNMISHNNCSHDESNKELNCEIIKEKLYLLETNRDINKLLVDLNYFNKIKLINIITKFMLTIIDLIKFYDFTDNNILVDLNQLNIEENYNTKNFIHSLKKNYDIIDFKQQGGISNYNLKYIRDIIENNRKKINNSKILFIKNDILYTTKKTNTKNILINNTKLYPLNILKGGAQHTEKEIDDFINDIFIDYDTITNTLLSDDYYLKNKEELILFITYVIGFSNILRYSDIISYNDSLKLNEYFHFYQYYLTLLDSDKSDYIEIMLKDISTIVMNIRKKLVSYCKIIAVKKKETLNEHIKIAEELLEKEKIKKENDDKRAKRRETRSQN